MRYKKALLICPGFQKGRNRLSLRPLAGIAYIAEALKKTNVTTEVFDMNLGYNFKDLTSRIKKFKPDIVGLTIMTFGHKDVYTLIGKIKKINPKLKIVVGGPHISALKEKIMLDCPEVDFGIILEGDISTVQLCMGEAFANIQGLMYRDTGKIITNKFQCFIDDLDKLSFPKYESFELHKYPTKQLGIVTSRGCPYDCIYCSVVASIGKKFRIRSAESVVEEIEYWYNRGYRELYILDDNFTLIRSRVEEICSLLSKKNFSGIHLKCPNGIRADKVDRELLKKMKSVGFDMIAFGVEAASDNILKNIKKGERIATIEKSIKEACELGFDVDLFFLIGSPEETIKDVDLSFSLAKRYPIRRAIFYNLIPMPATELLDWLNEKNYLIHPLDSVLNNASYYVNEPCFFTPELSIEQRRNALKTGQRVSLEIRRSFIERKIKGPVVLKKLFSRIYTIPLVDDAINNNAFVIRFKDNIKRFMLR